MRRASVLKRLGGDEGATMMVALMVAGVSISLGVTAVLASSMVHRDSGLDRQRTVSIAAAEAGLDWAIGHIRTTAKWKQEAALSCGPHTFNAGAYPDRVTVTVTIRYRFNDGTPATCPIGSPDVSTAEITSVADAVTPLAGGTTKGERAMRADVKLTPPPLPPGSDMIYAMYSNNPLTLTNGLKVKGAGSKVYTGGNFDCNEKSDIEGTVLTQGTATVQNRCKLGGLHAKEHVYVKGGSSTPLADGTPNYPRILGDLMSTNGDADFFGNPASVSGTATMKGIVRNRSLATFGSLVQNNNLVPEPPSHALPAVPVTTLWSEPSTPAYVTRDWSDTVAAAATANGASNTDGPCVIRGAQSSVGAAGLVLPEGRSVFNVAQDCPSSVKFSGVKLTLRGDTVLYVPPFFAEAANNQWFEVATQPATSRFKLRIVVPSPTMNPQPTTVSCPATPATNITFTGDQVKMGSLLSDSRSNVETLLYTPGKIQFNNMFTMTGSAHACAVGQNSMTTITYADVGAPQYDAINGKLYDVAVRSKYEVKS